MPHSELDTDTPDQPSEELATVDEGESSALEDRHSSRQNDFTPWQEGPQPKQVTSEIGHRRIIKNSKVQLGEPVKITHEISFEPEPEPESVEITPLVEGEVVVGLRMTCGCGATHEVRFEYGEEQ